MWRLTQEESLATSVAQIRLPRVPGIRPRYHSHTLDLVPQGERHASVLGADAEWYTQSPGQCNADHRIHDWRWMCVT